MKRDDPGLEFSRYDSPQASEFWDIYNSQNVEIASAAADILPLGKEEEKRALINKLCYPIWLAQKWQKFRSPFHVRDWKRNSFKKISRAITSLENALNADEAAKVYLKKQTVLNFYASNEKINFENAMDQLLKLKTLIDTMPANMSGSKQDDITTIIGAELADLYFEVTGKAPARKSGAGYGTFYRFVEKALSGSELNAETVNRKSVEYWKARHA